MPVNHRINMLLSRPPHCAIAPALLAYPIEVFPDPSPKLGCLEERRTTAALARKLTLRNLRVGIGSPLSRSTSRGSGLGAPEGSAWWLGIPVSPATASQRCFSSSLPGPPDHPAEIADSTEHWGITPQAANRKHRRRTAPEPPCLLLSGSRLRRTRWPLDHDCRLSNQSRKNSRRPQLWRSGGAGLQASKSCNWGAWLLKRLWEAAHWATCTEAALR